MSISFGRLFFYAATVVLLATLPAAVNANRALFTDVLATASGLVERIPARFLPYQDDAIAAGQGAGQAQAPRLSSNDAVPAPLSSAVLEPVVPDSCAIADAGQGRAVAGDRVQLRFFEPATLDVAASPGSAVREAAFERLDLAGVYEVDDSGEVGLPLLGRIEARGYTLPCIEAAIALRFFNVSHAAISVSAAFASRPPIAVNGAVRSPGSYTATPGMTLAGLLAAAGSESSASGGDRGREAMDLEDRKSELERVGLGLSLSLGRAEAEVAGSTELALSEGARLKMAAVLGTRRLDMETAMLRAALSAAAAARTAAEAQLAGYDSRIAAAEERLAAIASQADRRSDRVTELATLQKKGVAPVNRVEELEFGAMSLERARLTAAGELTDLRVARDAQAHQAELAVAERRERLQKELLDLMGQKADVEAEIGRIDGRLARLGKGGSPSDLMVTIQRMTPDGPVEIAGEPSMPVLPGDVISVGIGRERPQGIAEGDIPARAASAIGAGIVTR